MSDIWRAAVIGMLVCRHPFYEPKVRGQTHFTVLHPLVAYWDLDGLQDDDDDSAGSEEAVVGLLPMTDAYKVWGMCSCGEGLELGFEFKGAFIPEWEEKLAEAIAEHRHRKAASG